MLNPDKFGLRYLETDAPETASLADLDIRHWLTLPLRRWRLLFCLLVVGIICGSVYSTLYDPSFTAISRILVASNEIRVYRDDILLPAPVEYAGFIDTQVEIIRSDAVLRSVATNLELSKDGEFLRTREQPSGYMQQLIPSQISAYFWPSTDGDAARQVAVAPAEAVVEALKNRLSVRPVGLSSIIQIGFTSNDAVKAASIANEVTRAYLTASEAANAETAKTASAWLRDRIRHLGVNARVVSAAVPPSRADGPGWQLILFGCALAGLALGTGAAVVREALDDRIRTPERAVAVMGIECFGLVPKHEQREAEQHLRKQIRGRGAHKLDRITDFPWSRFPEALLRLRAAAISKLQVGRPLTIGVTSVLLGEGRTTVAANLARGLAQAGVRVLLVDADAGQPTLSRLLHPNADRGLAEVLEGSASVEECVSHAESSNLDFLPLSRAGRSDVDVIESVAFARISKDLWSGYELVIFDLPAVAPAADVRASAEILDQFVFVLGWNIVTERDLKCALGVAGSALRDKGMGSVLNKGSISAPKRRLWFKTRRLSVAVATRVSDGST